MPRRDDAGIVRRELNDGTVRFYIRYVDVDGVRRMRLAEGARTRAEAKLIRDAARGNVMQGRVGIDPKADERRRARARMTVRDLGEKFLQEYENDTVKDMEVYRRKARSHLTVHIYARLGARAVVSLTGADFSALRKAMAEAKKSPDQIRLVMATAKKMFRWAVAADVIDRNPLDGVKLPSGRRSEIFYDEAEIEKILTAVRDERGEGDFALVQLLALTGMRKSEALALRWSDIRDDGFVDVVRAENGAPKNGERRTVPMHPHLADVLRAWKELCPETDVGLVFPQRGRGMRDESKRQRANRAELRQGGRDDLRWFRLLVERVVPEKKATHPLHALRHSFGSFLAQRGTYQAAIMAIMGHRTATASQRYLHAHPEHLREHVAALPALAPKAPTNVVSISTGRRRK